MYLILEVPTSGALSYRQDVKLCEPLPSLDLLQSSRIQIVFIHRVIQYWDPQNKYKLGRVINTRGLSKVPPNLNTFALSDRRAMSFIMLDLLVKACGVHSHLFSGNLIVSLIFKNVSTPTSFVECAGLGKLGFTLVNPDVSRCFFKARHLGK